MKITIHKIINIFKGKFLIIILYFIFTFCILSSIDISNSSSQVDNQNRLNEINELMLKLEYNIEQNNIEQICQKVNEIDNIIEQNKSILKELEPDYKWFEIQSLMKGISIQLCIKSPK